MNVLDTSGWLEYFEGGNNSGIFSAPIKEIAELVVPTICIYEISKVILQEINEDSLVQVLAAIQKGR